MYAVQRKSVDEEPQLYDDVPVPEPRADEVRVAIKAASLCGSDLEPLTGTGSSRFEYPLVLGHEGAGVVEAVGSSVTTLQVGDRVAIHYPTTCDRCEHCLAGHDNRCRNRRSVGTHRDGTFAEYLVVPSRSAIPLADSVPFEWGSIAACAVSTPYHAVSLAEIEPGDTVVVFGLGGVGVHAVMWASFFGAGTVIAVDVVSTKLELAAAYGADVLVNSAEENVHEIIEATTDGWGADAAIECSGSPVAMKQAIESINGRNRYESGSVVSVGLQTEPISVEYWSLREGRLLVSGDHTRAELDRILHLAKTGTINLSQSITHRLPLAKFADGVSLLEDGNEPVGRIVFEMP